MDTEIICNESLKGKTLISGFHGVGLVGIIAVRHVIKELGARKLGYVSHRELPLYVSIQDKKLVLPIELYGHENLVFLQVNPTLEPETVNDIAQEIVKKAKKDGAKEILLLGGLDESFKKGRSPMKGVCSSKGDLSEFNVPFMDSGLSVFGPLAAFLTQGEIENFPVSVLLPYATRSIPDPSAASKAIKKLEERYGLKISKRKLSKDARKIQEEISKLEQQMQGEEHPSMFR